MKGIIKKFCVWNDRIDRIFDFIMVILLAGIVISLTAQVIWRYIFSSPIIWTEELAKWLFIWSTFLGAAWAAKKNLHIEIVMVFKRLPSRVQQILQALCLVFCMFLLAVLLPPSVEKLVQQRNVISNTLKVPMSVLYACAPAGFVLLLLQYFLLLLQVIFDWDAYKAKFYKPEE